MDRSNNFFASFRFVSVANKTEETKRIKTNIFMMELLQFNKIGINVWTIVAKSKIGGKLKISRRIT
ncbi:hypothetical protein AYB33_17830 [Leptospira santarosai]|nr:hypothetical protein LEP1GSC162_0712 [Leptospira santarosai str. CBC1531]KXZ28314.1 hypothetical protein AYB33_17830 [Leptospira santarosai]